MFEKDFDNWNDLKKRLHGRASFQVAHAREVWWCALGTNVGSEIDGKHDNFERPVLVLRVYNKETLLVAPTTGRPRNDPFHKKISVRSKDAWVVLTQVRVISSRRLLRKLGMVSDEQFVEVRNALTACL